MTRYGYDDGGQLQTVDVDVRGATPTKAMVTDITYDARGRREAIAYGNDTDTAYTYAADSQRLTTLVTTRTSDSATLQDLRYFYDAVGNLVEQQDHAQQTVFFNNTQVSPHATYEYDALYRLTQAKGRERVGLAQAVQTSPAYGVVPEPGTTVLRLYTRNYSYDAVGNLTQLAQVGNWTRNYSYAATSNQLLSNSAPGGGTHSYSHSARGAMTQMPHLSSMTRDWRDQLRGVALGGGDDAVYHYDADGQRVRKVVRLGANTHDRVYLGAWELYDKAISGTQDTVRETLHVFDDRQRLAMVETLTVTNGNTVPSPTPRYRYQLDNHLGTACLELDDAAAVITYEEYHPFGTTSWHAEKSTIQVSKKRYRYTGMEKDEETGLSYHGARYYAPWLGRWCSADPAGMVDGPNRYAYVRNNPVRGRDPTGTQTVDDEVTVYGDEKTLGTRRGSVHVHEIPTEEVGTFGPGLGDVHAVTRLGSIQIDADLVVRRGDARIKVNAIDVFLETGVSELVDDVFDPKSGARNVPPEMLDRAIEDLKGVQVLDVVEKLDDERGRQVFSQSDLIQGPHEHSHQKDLRKGIRAARRFLRQQRLGPAVGGQPNLFAEQAFDRLRGEAKDVLKEVGLPRHGTAARFEGERRALRAELSGRVKTIRGLLKSAVGSGELGRPEARAHLKGLRRDIRDRLLSSVDRAEARTLDRARRQ